MVKRKKYTQEQKDRLVIELLTKQSSGAQICQREGIAYGTLKKWADAYQEGPGDDNGELARLRQENIELKTAVADLTLQVQIQKKIQEAVSQMRKNGR